LSRTALDEGDVAGNRRQEMANLDVIIAAAGEHDLLLVRSKTPSGRTYLAAPKNDLTHPENRPTSLFLRLPIPN
jgi:hypothetical protein